MLILKKGQIVRCSPKDPKGKQSLFISIILEDKTFNDYSDDEFAFAKHIVPELNTRRLYYFSSYNYEILT